MTIQDIPLLLVLSVLGIIYTVFAVMIIYFLGVINLMAWQHARWSKVSVVLNNLFIVSFITVCVISPIREPIHLGAILYLFVLFFTVIPATMSSSSMSYR